MTTVPNDNKVKRGLRRALTQACALLFTLCFLISATVAPAFAITQAEINALRQKQQEINSSKASLQQQISKVQTDQNKLVEKKLLIEEQVEVIRHELQITNSLIAGLDSQIATKAEELAAAEVEEARYYDIFCERVRAMEEGGDVSYWAVLFNANDFGDLIDRFNLVSEIMDYDNEMMDALEAARQVVAEAKDQLETLRGEQIVAKTALEASKAEMEKQQATLEALWAELRAKEDQYKKQVNEYAEDSVDLSREISAAEQQYANQLAAQRPSGGKPSSGNAVLTGSGGFIWPLPGHTKISSPYGSRKDPFSGRTSTHFGTDVPAVAGTSIIAAKAGTVVISAYNSSYGNYVTISHPDGTKTLYAHMKARACSAGQSVAQGAVIGYVGTTGSSTGNHLHFEVWLGSSSSSRTNPMNFF